APPFGSAPGAVEPLPAAAPPGTFRRWLLRSRRRPGWPAPRSTVRAGAGYGGCACASSPLLDGRFPHLSVLDHPAGVHRRAARIFAIPWCYEGEQQKGGDTSRQCEEEE